MAYEKFKRHEPCSQEDCAERSFYIGDDGYTYCRRGHQQSERGTVIAEDTGELVITGRKHKRIDSDAESISTTQSTLTGPRALENLLLCLQLILRMQVRWLIHQQGLPEEYEIIVKDLWTLEIQDLRPPALGDAGTDDERSSRFFSSQSEAESTDTRSARSRSSRSSRHRQQNTSPERRTIQLSDLLALLYIASLIIRASITVSDLHNWIGTGELLYYQSSRKVPVSLRKRMPGRYQHLLDPVTWLPPKELHRSVHNKIAVFRVIYGLQVPPINRSIILYRWVSELTLPLETYLCAKRLIAMTHLHVSYKADGRLLISRMPEVLLMAAVVVSAKLLFPMDNDAQRPVSLDNLAALRMDWQQWCAISGSARSQAPDTGMAFAHAFKATEKQCLSMKDDELDRYLDWYGEYIATEHISEQGRAGRDADFRRSLIAMFPVNSPGIASQISGNKRPDRPKSQLPVLQATLSAKPPTARRIHNGNATYLQIYKIEDLCAPQNSIIKHLYELASVLCCVELEHFHRAVRMIERRLERREKDLGNPARGVSGPS